MNRPLQQFGYKDSAYERPTQKWVCGRAAEGDPCHVGPDGSGRCSAHLESHCTPRRGDASRGEAESRWYCTRPEPYGGACECGPKPDGSCCEPEPEHLPCQPRLSVRARRGRATLAVALFTIGMLTLLIAGPWGMNFISPGAVTSAHQAAIGSGANSCAACHQPHPEHGAFLQPVADTACLQCHAAEAHFPASSTAEVGALMQIAGHLDPIHMAAGCADCHNEHNGPAHNLSSLSDSTCTSCHANLAPWRKIPDPSSSGGSSLALHITSFPADHPEFQAVREGEFDSAAVRFEHHVHMDPTAKGMQERLEEWAKTLRAGGVSDQQIPIDRLDDGQLRLGCAACHGPDTAGRFMLPISFARHCDHCHDLGTKADERVPHGPDITNYVTRIAAKLVMSPPEPPQSPAGPARGGPPSARPGGPPSRPGPPAARPSGPPSGPPAPAARPSGPPSGPPARPSGPPGAPRGGPPSTPQASSPKSQASLAGLAFASAAERSQWFNQRLTEETKKLNRSLSATCGKCHGPKADPADMIAPGIRERWYPEARFSHAAHGFMQCAACHAGAALTREPPQSSGAPVPGASAPELRWTGRTKEIMIPGVDTCRACHGDTSAPQFADASAASLKPQASSLSVISPARHDCITCHRFHVPDLTGDPRVVPATPRPRPRKVLPPEVSATK